jgi:hypothetical protein
MLVLCLALSGRRTVVVVALSLARGQCRGRAVPGRQDDRRETNNQQACANKSRGSSEYRAHDDGTDFAAYT